MKNKFSFLNDVAFELIDTPLSEHEIKEFEELNGIMLPEEYRYFLKYIGNGIVIKKGDKDLRHVNGIRRPMEKRYNNRLALNFIFNKVYHERANSSPIIPFEDCIDPEGESDDSCDKCKHLNECFYAYSDSFDGLNYPYYNGAFPVCYAGCTYTYFLVVSGKRRGEVWIDNELMDFVPVRQSFSSFLKWVCVSECI